MEEVFIDDRRIRMEWRIETEIQSGNDRSIGTKQYVK